MHHVLDLIMGEEEVGWLVNRKHEAATMTEQKCFAREGRIYEMLKNVGSWHQ